MDYTTMYSYLTEELNHSHEEALHAVAIKAVQLSVEVKNKKGDQLSNEKIYEFMEDRVNKAFWESDKRVMSSGRFISTVYDSSKGRKWKESMDQTANKVA